MILIKHQVLEFVSDRGRNPFRQWIATLPRQVAARIQARLYAVELGTMGDWKSVGGGVNEFRIHRSPGYRIYFGREGPYGIILLGGGTKRTQSRDILKAKRNWALYRGGSHATTKR
jgi:putative addiction module killer protein